MTNLNFIQKNFELNNYILIDSLKHKELIPFLKEKNKLKTGFFMYFYFLSLIISVFFVSYYFTISLLTGNLEILKSFICVFLGILFSILFIPIHELLHAFAYKLLGAKNISYYIKIKKFYFAVVSDKHIVNFNQFIFIALSPFLFVIFSSLILFLFSNTYISFTVIVFVTIHNLFCSGDFSLLNFMEINKDKGIITYDDKEKQETYFYIKNK
jgi:hypothetical protein